MRPVLEPVEPRMLLATFMVTNTSDSGAGSLRQAILDTNATTGQSQIDFAITTSPLVIQPITPLPFVNNSAIIDATTQPGFAGTPVVYLDGSKQVGSGDGLTFEAGNSSVRGLSISNFPVEGLSFHAAGNNLVAGDVFYGNGDAGVLLSDSGGDRVGGLVAADAVVSSYNRNVGVEVVAGSNNNVIEGSFLGTDPTGTTAGGNGLDGIFIQGSTGNTIGGEVAAAANVIGGSSDAAIQISGAGASANLIVGNKIGVGGSGEGASLNASGSSRVVGVFINGSPGNSIGAAVPGGGNLISGLVVGVQITGTGATNNLVAGNLIGTDAAGSKAIPNLVGVYVNAASNNTIGGLTVSARNVIAGSTQVGIDLEPGSTYGTLVEGNYIGLTSSGTTALGNGRDGVYINSSGGNTIGGSLAGAGNLIAGDASVGIQLYGSGATGNVVSGNTVGLNSAGTAVGTGLVGIFLNGSPYNTITNNTVSGGTYAGLQQAGTTAIGNAITANTVNNTTSAIVADNVKQNSIPVTGVGANVVSGVQKVIATTTDGPAVLLVTPVTVGTSITGLTLTFSKPLSAVTAQSLTSYGVISSAGRVALASATYNPSTLQVTLTFVAPVSSSGAYQVTVIGTGRFALTDATGHRLDGRGIGKSSGNFTANFGSGAVVSTSRLDKTRRLGK